MRYPTTHFLQFTFTALFLSLLFIYLQHLVIEAALRNEFESKITIMPELLRVTYSRTMHKTMQPRDPGIPVGYLMKLPETTLSLFFFFAVDVLIRPPLSSPPQAFCA